MKTDEALTILRQIQGERFSVVLLSPFLLSLPKHERRLSTPQLI